MAELLAKGGEAGLVACLDALVARHWGEGALFGTSVVARSRQRGRLYVFGLAPGLDWSDVHRRHGQLVADLTGVALEQEALLQDRRRHERLDRQLGTGAEIQAQLLPDRCPVIEGWSWRPAVGRPTWWAATTTTSSPPGPSSRAVVVSRGAGPW
jgi:sigma-B regulation protein RsbU (phosphoserine phosphatase)